MNKFNVIFLQKPKLVLKNKNKKVQELNYHDNRFKIRRL
jgi:hypothetical protein